jgi:hypothetical protein
MPTKNEDWIIKQTISSASEFVDNIIVSDQSSTDKTIEILEAFKKVEIISNKRSDHSNIVRWELLEESRKKFGYKNLVLNLDADEFLPQYLFLRNKKKIVNQQLGTIFSSPWVQLWRSINQYRNDNSVWNPKKNKKSYMFLDDGKVGYEKNFTINDHTSRVPTLNTKQTIELKMPLIHLQFANWERSQMKQVWYMCKELISGISSEEINQKYVHSMNEEGIKYSKSKSKWFVDKSNFENIQTQNPKSLWYFKEIELMFLKYGVQYFQELNIWENKHLNNFLYEL